MREEGGGEEDERKEEFPKRGEKHGKEEGEKEGGRPERTADGRRDKCGKGACGCWGGGRRWPERSGRGDEGMEEALRRRRRVLHAVGDPADISGSAP